MRTVQRYLGACCCLGIIVLLGTCDLFASLRSPLDGTVKQTATVALLAGGAWGMADGTGTSAQFNNPYDMCSDGTNLYVADTWNDSIRKVVIATGVVTTIAGLSGTSGYVNATGTSARFNRPEGICTDGTSLYVADTANYCIRQIVIGSGVVTTLAGTNSPGYVNATGTAARFNFPYHICRVGTDFYVTDGANNAVRSITAAGVVTTFAGDTAGSAGSADGVGTTARFNTPFFICPIGAGLYVQDNNGARYVTIPDASVTTAHDASGGALGTWIGGAAYDGAGILYVASASSITKVLEPLSSTTKWDKLMLQTPQNNVYTLCLAGTDLFFIDLDHFGIYKLTGTTDTWW